MVEANQTTWPDNATQSFWPDLNTSDPEAIRVAVIAFVAKRQAELQEKLQNEWQDMPDEEKLLAAVRQEEIARRFAPEMVDDPLQRLC